MDELNRESENGKSSARQDIEARTTAGKDSEASIREDFYRMPWHSDDGEIDSMENGFEFSQSEIIDFSQGTDSVEFSKSEIIDFSQGTDSPTEGDR